MNRRIALAGGAMGLVSMLTGCGVLRPGKQAVEDAIEGAPAVTGAEISFGAGGGLGSLISGSIELDVAADQLRDAFDEAWGLGVEVLHRRYGGDRGIKVAKVAGIGSEGAEVTATELVDLGESTFATLGHFYDHYGIS
ncbi:MULTISPECIES: hypothetical protein [unclassified Brachybacterium]